MAELDDRIGHREAEFVRLMFTLRKSQRQLEGETKRDAHEGAKDDAGGWIEAFSSGFLEYPQPTSRRKGKAQAEVEVDQGRLF